MVLPGASFNAKIAMTGLTRASKAHQQCTLLGKMRSKRNWVIWTAFIGMFVPIVMTLGPDFVASLSSYTWKKVPCTMVSSKLTQAPYDRDTPTALHYQLQVE